MSQPSQTETSIYSPRPCRLLSVNKLTPQDKLFRLQLRDGSELQHQPGQFIQLSIPGLTDAPLSVASSPTRNGYFELGVRKAGILTSALHRLQPGEQVGIRGPFGRPFQLDDLRGKQLLLIAGGCGLAPLRSLIQYCQDRRDEFATVQIFYGARSPQDMLFQQDLSAWQTGGSFNCRYTVDKKPVDSCFDGETGLITNLLNDLQIDAANSCAVIVGPPTMYRPVISALRRLGLNSEKQIMVSLERQMRCGVGKCGHCTIEHLYCCQDGPIFWLEEVEHLRGAL
ncbi:FAD/NAD(P)-binding protein [Malonomonas rubra]|uniref:FAD/NAD(P)-binding protein n=1 Tax=Malonomonas rubra TaxID=57040 RepID=UPI0026ED5DA0|nr:FAD/NAD(P)-binding protein [Malonomonas rubra]